MSEDGLNDPLFLACTRPAMKWGVPYAGLRVNVIGTLIFGMVMGSPLWWIVAVFIHIPMRGLTAWDHNFFRIMGVWLETKGASVGATLMPLPSRPNRRATEFPSAV